MSNDLPRLRVVSGSPTPEELAVLTAVVAAASSAGDAPAPTPDEARGRWNDPAWSLRRPLFHGPGAWRSALHR